MFEQDHVLSTSSKIILAVSLSVIIVVRCSGKKVCVICRIHLISLRQRSNHAQRAISEHFLMEHKLKLMKVTVTIHKGDLGSSIVQRGSSGHSSFADGIL